MTARSVLILALCMVALAAVPGVALGQRPDSVNLAQGLRQLGANPSQAEIVAFLRSTGLSRTQARAELLRRGIDPAPLDQYYDIIEQESGTAGDRERQRFLDALAEIGVARGGAGSAVDSLQGLRAGLDSLDPSALSGRSLGATGDSSLGEGFGAQREDLASGELPIYGRSFFARPPGLLEQPAFGPLPASYRLGPGDEVDVVLTGAVEDAYKLQINRDGMLFVPVAGGISANGVTLQGLEDRLRARLASVYSSVGSGANALTRVSVSLGRVRTIEVTVTGDAERPGTIQLSALGTVMSALQRAGGPAKSGSSREVQVLRGGQLAHRFDLYAYLLQGTTAADFRLEHGDNIFVPVFGRRVHIKGAVRRPSSYELIEGEGLRAAIAFAGGPAAEAALRRVQIDRVARSNEPNLGADRIKIEVDLAQLMDPAQRDVELADGDTIRVFSVSEERRNVVSITGAVRRPGTYGWGQGSTLSDLLESANGLSNAAYTDRVHIYRLDPSTGDRTLRSVSLTLDANGRPLENFALEDRDSIVVFNRDRVRAPQFVTIEGLVKRPGRYELTDGITVDDLILQAGGFVAGANQTEAYVGRPDLNESRPDSTARSFGIPLALGVSGGTPATPGNGGNAAGGSARGLASLALRDGDIVQVRALPGYDAAPPVTVTGEVHQPGAYLLETRLERISSLIHRAGGLNELAHAPGIRILRDGDVLPARVDRALTDPGSEADIELLPGDSIEVPRYDPTVLVFGAVGARKRVPYRPGMDLDDFVQAAGGYSPAADRRGVTITYANGESLGVEVRSLRPDRTPALQPGSQIFVPERNPELRSGIDWSTLISQLIGAAGAAATLIIALNNR